MPTAIGDDAERGQLVARLVAPRRAWPRRASAAPAGTRTPPPSPSSGRRAGRSRWSPSSARCRGSATRTARRRRESRASGVTSSSRLSPSSRLRPRTSSTTIMRTPPTASAIATGRAPKRCALIALRATQAERRRRHEAGDERERAAASPPACPTAVARALPQAARGSAPAPPGSRRAGSRSRTTWRLRLRRRGSGRRGSGVPSTRPADIR